MELAVPDVLHDFPIKAPIQRVFQAISSPNDLDCWWTMSSAGSPSLGSEYLLGFGPQYDWRAEVSRCHPHTDFELRMIDTDDDWTDTRVGFRLEERGAVTWVQFYHAGWRSSNEHFRISSNCWALYLRVLRRYLEYGESVAYENRLQD
jgi:uncharacterized protein YndB with AHSA1/START domain